MYQDTTGGRAGVYWTTPENIFSSNDARATYPASNGVTDLSARLVATGFGFNIPTGSVILGISVAIECSNGDSNSHGNFAVVSGAGVTLITNGTRQTGHTKVDTDATPEFGTTDEVHTFGSATDPWGPFTADDVNNLGVEMIVGFDAPTGNDLARIDHVTVTVTYIPPGSAFDLPVGGYDIGLNPVDKDQWGLVIPESDELTSVSVRRKAAIASFTYHSDGDDITAEMDFPHVGLDHVEHMAWGSGGLGLIGDNSSGIGTSFKFRR